MMVPTDGAGRTPGTGRKATEFETAQHEPFEAVGIDARSRFVDRERPRARTDVLEAGPPGEDPVAGGDRGTRK